MRHSTPFSFEGGALGREREVASERTDAAANAATNLIRTTHELGPKPHKAGPKPHKASAGNGLARQAPTTHHCTVLTHTNEHTKRTVDSAVRSDAPPQTEVSVTDRLYAVRVKVTPHS